MASPHLKAPVSPGSSLSEIVPGTLFALGGLLAPERKFSVLQTGRQGFMPVRAYALHSNGAMMLVDTGLGCHLGQILDGIDHLKQLFKPARIGLILSRREPDVIINLPELVSRCPLETVYCGGEIDPFDFFDIFDNANAEAIVSSTAGRPLRWITAGASLSIGELRLEVVRVKLRVLTTFWLFERTTGTLFSTDMFVFCAPERGGPTSVLSGAEAVTAAAIRDYLSVKFDWLIGTDTGPIISDLEAIAATYPIERICPTLGCVIEGKEAVSRVFALLVDVLREMAGMRRRSALGGIDLVTLGRN